MEDIEYKAHLTDLAGQVAQKIAANQPLSLDQIVEGLIPGHTDNAGFRNLLVRTAGVNARDFDKAMQRRAVREAIGIVPQTAQEFALAVIAQEQIECRYDGTLLRVGPTQAKLANGEVILLTDEHLHDERMRVFAQMVGGRSLRFSELQRHLRMRRDELKLGFSDTQIADATEHWYALAKCERLFALHAEVAGPIADRADRERIEAAFLALAEGCFDTGDTSPTFVAAVLKKFIWQVKRKLLGIAVTDHLMPVLLGPQGVGKTTFVRGLTSPLAEITAKVDFRMIADERNIDLWMNYIMFIDEMGYATMTDVDVIKGIISAEVLTRRPMRTNSFDIVPQHGTFIGCSNKELRQLVRDPTGLRRFVGLRFRRDADWALINETLWLELWRFVDARAEDPMRPFAGDLNEQQEEERHRSPVEAWVAQFKRACVASHHWDGDAVRASDLYRRFREYEEEFHPGSRTSITEWGTEMTRLSEASGADASFKKFRDARGFWYRYNPAKKVAVVTGGAKAA